jgi:NADPH:quinone reductase-like Zn-dependent oxidoreductase
VWLRVRSHTGGAHEPHAAEERGSRHLLRGWGTGKNTDQVRDLNARLFELAEQRDLNVTIGHRLPMHQAAAALELVAARGTIGKIVSYAGEDLA